MANGLHAATHLALGTDRATSSGTYHNLSAEALAAINSGMPHLALLDINHCLPGREAIERVSGLSSLEVLFVGGITEATWHHCCRML